MNILNYHLLSHDRILKVAKAAAVAYEHNVPEGYTGLQIDMRNPEYQGNTIIKVSGLFWRPQPHHVLSNPFFKPYIGRVLPEEQLKFVVYSATNIVRSAASDADKRNELYWTRLFESIRSYIAFDIGVFLTGVTEDYDLSAAYAVRDALLSSTTTEIVIERATVFVPVVPGVSGAYPIYTDAEIQNALLTMDTDTTVSGRVRTGAESQVA
jgi:hypothetical protein